MFTRYKIYAFLYREFLQEKSRSALLFFIVGERILVQ
jgi:hypothetical protein